MPSMGSLEKTVLMFHIVGDALDITAERWLAFDLVTDEAWVMRDVSYDRADVLQMIAGGRLMPTSDVDVAILKGVHVPTQPEQAVRLLRFPLVPT